MFCHRVARAVLRDAGVAAVAAALDAGEDATLAVAQSARTMVVASVFARDPRPTIYIVPGEEAADRAALALGAWLGTERVLRFRERRDWPWQDKPADDAVIGERTRAIGRLAQGRACVVVCSAHALMRRVPPKGSGYWASSTFKVGDEVPFEDMGALLVGMGYSDDGEAATPGTFHIHGDAVDIFAAQATSPVRIEFFGDEIDRIRCRVATTGQTIGDLPEVEISPARELALTAETIANARRALYEPAKQSGSVAADLELIEAASTAPTIDQYLGLLYDGHTAMPLDHASQDTLVVLDEPRALFDDCQRYADRVVEAAGALRVDLNQLYTMPARMDFGSQQRLSLSSIMRSGSTATAQTEVRQPDIAGSDNKLLNRIHQLVSAEYAVVFAVPDHGARSHLELVLADEHISFSEVLANDPSCQGKLDDAGAFDQAEPPEQGMVCMFDAPVPAGVVLPGAKLAVLSVGDLTQRSARRVKKRIDPTTVTFPFKPGDYVVHATHGIALFADIVRQEVGGRERDYFLLEYAGGDKLFVPLEQVDRITRYVGPDGSSPRLTRLNNADWSRATGKARASAKRLAFDLVDLYTRRASVPGYAFAADTPAQADMEAAFPYELTPDQASALADIKADMESARPMDRLLCGDVGFGKTEVALRAAFKCVMDGKQVMVLCPTTILAEQHYQTFFNRFSPFDVDVRVLSRFVSPARQRKALAGFAAGDVRVLIGTHRLLSADVSPKELGMVIIDEEQRFGVQHKEQLKNMREQVDVLTLSATPIPRTMQMAMSGVRDMSLIMTPPPGRRPVEVHVGEWDQDVVSDAIRRELERGGQVYYVSNRVKSIDDAVERVREAAPEARVGFAHGQMSATEVEDVMMRFEAHEIEVLVATTIIESGIDNPHTNTLIIEDAQRLGLAQLYQLKGRVGRGRTQAYAYFMFPGTQPLTPEATDRLLAIGEFQDLGSGMRIAMRDLEIRGAGSLMGAEQHGNLSSVGFDLFTQMLGEAVAEARGETPDVEQPEITINLPADFYLAEEYVGEVDKRVLAYRKIAAASELATLDEIEADLEREFGALPLAGRNLLDRARIRIRGQRLGLASVALIDGRLIFMGLDVGRAAADELKKKGALVYAKTHKVAYPFKRAGYAGRAATSHKMEDLLPAALGMLEIVGGDDEDELRITYI